MINLEIPKKFVPLVGQAHQVAMNMLRPISRKYDKAEHEYPKELDMLASLVGLTSRQPGGYLMRTRGISSAGEHRLCKPRVWGSIPQTST